jgi:antitoxin ParD1/3/4
MTLTLDPRLEMRIQQKIEDGSHREASEVIDHALDLLDADESWSDAEKAQLDQHLAESMAQIQRGEGIDGDEARALLAERRRVRLS